MDRALTPNYEAVQKYVALRATLVTAGEDRFRTGGTRYGYRVSKDGSKGLVEDLVLGSVSSIHAH